MKVLLLESDARAGDDAAARLREAGHAVERCHERDLPAFPCNGLGGDGRCPLSDQVIDVALVVRSHPWPRPAPLEDGVVCALRSHIPLVVAGRTLLNPYEDWATAVVDGTDDVVGAVEAAAGSRLTRLEAGVGPAVVQILELAGRDASCVEVDARRHRGRVTVTLGLGPDVDEHTVRASAIAAHQAVRRLDDHAPGVDVRVARPAAAPPAGRLTWG